jgi:hypothetical protein
MLRCCVIGRFEGRMLKHAHSRQRASSCTSSIPVTMCEARRSLIPRSVAQHAVVKSDASLASESIRPPMTMSPMTRRGALHAAAGLIALSGLAPNPASAKDNSYEMEMLDSLKVSLIVNSVHVTEEEKLCPGC